MAEWPKSAHDTLPKVIGELCVAGNRAIFKTRKHGSIGAVAVQLGRRFKRLAVQAKQLF